MVANVCVRWQDCAQFQIYDHSRIDRLTDAGDVREAEWSRSESSVVPRARQVGFIFFKVRVEMVSLLQMRAGQRMRLAAMKESKYR